MSQLPPFASWEGLHPFVIHFPIALLFLAPLLVFLGVCLRRGRGRPLLISALLIMILGTLSLYLAAHSGHAAGARILTDSPAATVLQQHHKLGEEARLLFTAVTAIFALLLLAATRLQLSPRELVPVVPIAFLVFYGVGVILLIDVVREGCRLAHEFGQ